MSTQLKASPLIVEVIGLAGTGKSTLTRILCLENTQFRPGPLFDVRSAKHFPYMVKHAMLSLPTILHRPESGRWLSRREMAKVLYLNGWHHKMRQNGSTNRIPIIVDQGPIYDMAYLYSFGPDALRKPRHDAWWQATFDRWAHTIDLVIWLIAPMDVLIDRIRSREQQHPVKERSDQEITEYLSKYQTAFEYVLSELLSIHHLRVLKLDTGNNDQDDIATQARNAIVENRDALLQIEASGFRSKSPQSHAQT